MPDGSHDARAARQAKLEAELAAARERFLADTPDLTPEELEELERQSQARHRQERRARAPYKPRSTPEQHGLLMAKLPMWTIVQAKPNISAAELRVYAVLRIRARPGRPRVQIARSELATIARVSDRHVLRCLYELQEAGLIKPWAEVRMSRDYSETNVYELVEKIAWPRETDPPAERQRQIRRARYDMNVTPSGCPTDTFRSAPGSETPEGGAGTSRAAGRRPEAAPALPNSTERRLAPPGALAEGRTRKRRATPATPTLATGAEREPCVIDLEELLERSNSRSTSEVHHEQPDAGAG